MYHSHSCIVGNNFRIYTTTTTTAQTPAAAAAATTRNETLTKEWIEPRLEVIRQASERRQRGRTLQQEYSTIANYDCYLDYEGMIEWMNDFVIEAEPFLDVTLEDIGDSFLKTKKNSEGNDIHVLKVSGKNATNNTAPFFITTSIHAREYSPPEMVRRWLLHLLEQVQQENTLYLSFLQHTTIHWIPYVNPDGRVVAETTEPWRRKNVNSDWNQASVFCSDDDYGVDLNRNYPFQWGRDDGSSDQACSPFARGEVPGSEPETEAVILYAQSIFPESQRGESLQTSNSPPDSISVPKYDDETTTGVFVDVSVKIIFGLIY